MTWTTSAFDTLITEVAAHAATTCPQPLPPPATAEELADAEQHLGFPLHPLLRRLYTEIANGGFGPEYLLFPLAGEGESVTSEYAALTAATATATTTTGAPTWPQGVVPILTYGSDMYAGVDCTDPNGAVLLHEPSGNPDDPADTWFLDNESLAAWLQVWIADTGWYREDSDLDEFPQELFLWPAAAARLTTAPASYPNFHQAEPPQNPKTNTSP